MQIVLKNTPCEKRNVVAALERFALGAGLPEGVVQAADLALEEHLTNLMSYGFTDGREHEIIVRFTVEGLHLLVEVEDDGREFNPLTVPEVDTTVPLDQRPVGGLGIHLLRRFMDQLEYHRQGGKNVLRMRKQVVSRDS